MNIWFVIAALFFLLAGNILLGICTLALAIIIGNDT